MESMGEELLRENFDHGKFEGKNCWTTKRASCFVPIVNDEEAVFDLNVL